MASVNSITGLTFLIWVMPFSRRLPRGLSPQVGPWRVIYLRMLRWVQIYNKQDSEFKFWFTLPQFCTAFDHKIPGVQLCADLNLNILLAPEVQGAISPLQRAFSCYLWFGKKGLCHIFSAHLCESILLKKKLYSVHWALSLMFIT
jgi:hypothetical protein